MLQPNTSSRHTSGCFRFVLFLCFVLCGIAGEIYLFLMCARADCSMLGLVLVLVTVITLLSFVKAKSQRKMVLSIYLHKAKSDDFVSHEKRRAATPKIGWRR